jgi:hypothetical protein
MIWEWDNSSGFSREQSSRAESWGAVLSTVDFGVRGSPTTVPPVKAGGITVVRIPSTEPAHCYYCEPSKHAALSISTYNEWFWKQIPSATRTIIRASEKRGVVVSAYGNGTYAERTTFLEWIAAKRFADQVG